MAAWNLRFDPGQIPELAARYVDKLSKTDPKQMEVQAIKIGREANRRGGFTYQDFLDVCAWKTSRSKSRCARNKPETVEEATRIALSASTEEVRIGILQCLDGVAIPTASALLHVSHSDPYPLLDYRALWSWGFAPPPGREDPSWWDYVQYSYRLAGREIIGEFKFWCEYVQKCRQLAQQEQVSMRDLDRALWQYSKEQS